MRAMRRRRSLSRHADWTRTMAGSASDGFLAEQPVDDARRRASQAERQRHTHQHFVAIEFWGR